MLMSPGAVERMPGKATSNKLLNSHQTHWSGHHNRHGAPIDPTPLDPEAKTPPHLPRRPRMIYNAINLYWNMLICWSVDEKVILFHWICCFFKSSVKFSSLSIYFLIHDQLLAQSFGRIVYGNMFRIPSICLEIFDSLKLAEYTLSCSSEKRHSFERMVARGNWGKHKHKFRFLISCDVFYCFLR